MIIRQERPEDYDTVYHVVKEAFENAEYTDGNEQNLVAALRKSKSFIPELSLVAVEDEKIVGHILFFRIMKTEFEARPVYVRREERIKAHFMTCYISLLLYRLLEKKLGDAYTVSQILGTLRSMQMTLLNIASGYIPSYTRTELTDSLHKTFGFRTDYEFITKASMRTIIKETKQIKSKKS